MTIDPMNAPIFGDLVPADPPRPIKLATALLLGNVVVTAGYRFYTAFEHSGLATTIDLAVLVVSAGMLVTAIRLMWLADVNDYFTP
jgi:hypothetical protein